MKFKKIVATCLTLSSLALPVCVSASAWWWPFSKGSEKIERNYCQEKQMFVNDGIISHDEKLMILALENYLSNYAVCHDQLDDIVAKRVSEYIKFLKNAKNLEPDFRNKFKEAKANNDNNLCKDIYEKNSAYCSNLLHNIYSLTDEDPTDVESRFKYTINYLDELIDELV